MSVDRLLTLCCLLGVTTLAALPLIVFGAVRQQRLGGAIHKRAALFALVNAALFGLGASILMFLFVASIGDESAGEALFLVPLGGIGTALVFYVVTHLGVWLFGRSRSAPGP